MINTMTALLLFSFELILECDIYSHDKLQGGENMITGDGAYIKKINRGLILKEIIGYGMISRADLSKRIGLNKATISVQVADLLKEELIYESKIEHSAVGRRPIMLSINDKAAYVLGIDLDYQQIRYTVSDLKGHSVQSDVITFKTENFDEIIKLLVKQIKEYAENYSNSRYGLVSVIVGIHGTVNKDETILFVPSYQWHQKDIKTKLEKELDNIVIFIENNANLSSYAERAYNYHLSDNLLTLILTSGIGSGVMIDRKLQKGYHGYAGEMGHMITVPDGEPCKCGNSGCWELYASEPQFFKKLSKKLNNLNLTFEDIQKLILEKDPTTLEEMKIFIKYLSIGLNNIINLYNPQTLVLNSHLLELYPDATKEIQSNLKCTISDYDELVLSNLGNNACVLGACALAIHHFLEVPDLTFPIVEDEVLV